MKKIFEFILVFLYSMIIITLDALAVFWAYNMLASNFVFGEYTLPHVSYSSILFLIMFISMIRINKKDNNEVYRIYDIELYTKTFSHLITEFIMVGLIALLTLIF